MAISLYNATVANFLRTIDALQGVFQIGLEHSQKTGVDPTGLLDCRLCEDMLPLRYQAHAAAHHSAGAIAGVKAGLFSPPPEMDLADYASVQARVAQAADELRQVTPDEVNALEGKDVLFKFGEFEMPFVVEDFLMAFSLPNFYFHTTTAYDLLRMKGVPVGKRDFMGNLPVKQG